MSSNSHPSATTNKACNLLNGEGVLQNQWDISLSQIAIGEIMSTLEPCNKTYYMQTEDTAKAYTTV